MTFLGGSLGVNVRHFEVSRGVLQGTIVVVYSAFKKHRASASMLPTMFHNVGFILVLRSTLLYIFREVEHVPYDPSLSMSQSSSQVSPSVSAWHFLIFLVSSSAILTGQARNGVSKSRTKTQLVTASRTFMILASLLWDP